MEKTKLLTITVIGLLVLNLAILVFLFISNPKNHVPANGGKRIPNEIIIEKLNFDATQQKKYNNLIKWHRGKIIRLDTNIRNTKNELYSQLNQTKVNLKTNDSLITLLNSYQKQVEETHFKHFEEIKKLCHQNQLEDFNELTEDLSRIFGPNKPPRP